MQISSSAAFLRGLDVAQIRNLVNVQLCLMDYKVLCTNKPSTTRFDGVRLGPIDLYRYEGSGLRRGDRRFHHIREDRVSDFVICVPLQGSSSIFQGGSLAKVNPGEFAVLSTAMPFQASIGTQTQGDSFSSYQARIAGARLRERISEIDCYCNRPIQIRKGATTIMQSLFELSLREGGDLPESQSRQLGTMLIDMVANSVDGAPELAGLRAAAAQPMQALILEKAKAFIESNLTDPELDVTMAAEHCHVSVRTLQAAFASASLTVTSYIRERRLQQCRNALKNPAFRRNSITQLALMWGFNDPAYFSRTYRALFGSAPSNDRFLNAAD